MTEMNAGRTLIYYCRINPFWATGFYITLAYLSNQSDLYYEGSLTAMDLSPEELQRKFLSYELILSESSVR